MGLLSIFVCSHDSIGKYTTTFIDGVVRGYEDIYIYIYVYLSSIIYLSVALYIYIISLYIYIHTHTHIIYIYIYIYIYILLFIDRFVRGYDDIHYLLRP